MNVLDAADPHLAVDHLVGIFHRLFEAYWGPRTDDVLRVAALTALQRPGATLADIPRLLTEPVFRSASDSAASPTPPCGGSGGLREDEPGRPVPDGRSGHEQAPGRAHPALSWPRCSARRPPVSTSGPTSSTAGCSSPGSPRAPSGEDSCRLLGRSWWPRCGRASPLEHERNSTPGSTPPSTSTSARTSSPCRGR